ncbi:hypothetical protein D9600_14715 [Deinococcus sp. DB0503]|nr:hypothetical protein [Deinococcus sp. DB0503]
MPRNTLSTSARVSFTCGSRASRPSARIIITLAPQVRLHQLQVTVAQRLPAAEVHRVAVLAARDDREEIAQRLGVPGGSGGLAAQQGMVLERVLHGSSVRVQG